MLILIASVDKNNGIGRDNKLVIKDKDDMNFFKNMTIYKNVVMGRETYESIGRLLPNRHNIILTKDHNYKVKGAMICNDIDFIIKTSEMIDYYIIGGESIYKQVIDYADKIYLSKFNIETDANKFFPEIKENLFRIYNLYSNSKFTIREYNRINIYERIFC